MNQPLSNVELHIMWRETDTRLDVLRKRVREGVDVMAASEFSRWLEFSGLLGVLSHHERGMPLPVRGAELHRKVTELTAACGEWFSLHERSNVQPHPEIPRTELERINAQLAAIQGQLAKLDRGATSLEIVGGCG